MQQQASQLEEAAQREAAAAKVRGRVSELEAITIWAITIWAITI